MESLNQLLSLFLLFGAGFGFVLFFSETGIKLWFIRHPHFAFRHVEKSIEKALSEDRRVEQKIEWFVIEEIVAATALFRSPGGKGVGVVTRGFLDVCTQEELLALSLRCANQIRNNGFTLSLNTLSVFLFLFVSNFFSEKTRGALAAGNQRQLKFLEGAAFLLYILLIRLIGFFSSAFRTALSFVLTASPIEVMARGRDLRAEILFETLGQGAHAVDHFPLKMLKN